MTYNLAIFYLSAVSALAYPSPDTGSSLADCLTTSDPSFPQLSEFIDSSAIEACAHTLPTRDLKPATLSSEYSPGGLLSRKDVQYPSSLTVPGKDVALNPSGNTLLVRDDAPPEVQFSTSDVDTSLLQVIMEPDALINWADIICYTATRNLDPKQHETSGVFNYNIQGTVLSGNQKNLHLLVTFKPTNPEQLPRYNLKSLCEQGVKQASLAHQSVKDSTGKAFEAVSRSQQVQMIQGSTGQLLGVMSFGIGVPVKNIQTIKGQPKQQ